MAESHFRIHVAHIAARASVSVTGRLEMMDLAASTFRVRDDAGNRIALEEVSDPDAAARLIGQVVTAKGRRAPRTGQESLALLGVTLSPAAPLPESWFTGGDPSSWQAELAKTGPDPEGAVEMSDEEFERFLAAARGA